MKRRAPFLPGLMPVLLLIAGCAAPNAPARAPAPPQPPPPSVMATVERVTVTAVVTVEHYPALTERSFMEACVGAGAGAPAGSATSTRRCGCMLQLIEERYALADFRQLEDNLSAGAPTPPEFQQFADRCAAQVPN